MVIVAVFDTAPPLVFEAYLPTVSALVKPVIYALAHMNAVPLTAGQHGDREKGVFHRVVITPRRLVVNRSSGASFA